ncbi:MAG: hypothetical protein U5N55_12005 [Cypionkella sp.]|nr:hypothetical protein [Cypionkella sp.]
MTRILEWIDGQKVIRDALPGEIDETPFAPPVPSSVTRMQGILAMGSERWAFIMAYRDLQTTPFQQRAIIDHAIEWYRESQNMDFFAYLLGLTQAEVDDLFRIAGAIRA